MCLCVYYICIYMHMYSSTADTCLHHAWLCWWGNVLGLGEKQEHFNIRKGTRLAWLPLLPAGSWCRSQWQVLVGFPQCYLHPEVRHYKRLFFQISGDNHPYEEQFWKFHSCFLSCLSCLWQAGAGSLPLWQYGTKQNVTGAVCDTQWAVSV